MIINYRKYGSVNKLRIHCVFVYLVFTYYVLLHLPLPDPDTVHSTHTMLNLEAFVFDFLKESPLRFSACNVGSFLEVKRSNVLRSCF